MFCLLIEYYPGCEVLFMNLANIHTIRKSFQSLRTLCSGPRDATKYVFVLLIYLFQCSSLHSHSHLIQLCWMWSRSLLVYYGHFWYCNLIMTQLFQLSWFHRIEPHIFKQHSLDFYLFFPFGKWSGIILTKYTCHGLNLVLVQNFSNWFNFHFLLSCIYYHNLEQWQ